MLVHPTNCHCKITLTPPTFALLSLRIKNNKVCDFVIAQGFGCYDSRQGTGHLHLVLRTIFSLLKLTPTVFHICLAITRLDKYPVHMGATMVSGANQHKMS